MGLNFLDFFDKDLVHEIVKKYDIEINCVKVPAEGEIQRIKIKNNIIAFEQAVGGEIQILPFMYPALMICNKNQESLKSNKNYYAIKGDFLLVGSNAIDFIDLTEKQMEQLEEVFA